MFNWCKNQVLHEQKSQIIIASSLNQQGPLLTQPLESSKTVTPSNKTIRKLKPDPRRVARSQVIIKRNCNQEVQVNIDAFKVKKYDEGTQTQRMGILQLRDSKQWNSLNCSRQVSPKQEIQQTNYRMLNTSKRYQQPQSGRKTSIDLKGQNIIKTKATVCLAQTLDKIQHCEDYKCSGVFGYDQIPAYNRSYEIEGVTDRRVHFQDSNQSGPQQPHLYHSKISNLPLYQNQMTFSSKYRAMFRNIESEFKKSHQKSEKRRSERKIKTRKDQRNLFYERETILSKYTDQHHHSSSRELAVEESVIVERDGKSMFSPVGRMHFSEDCSLYIAKENSIGLVVSIKEVPISFMDQISQELLIYRQMQTRAVNTQGILTLYQSQIDHNSYMFIKEPFTQILKFYIQNILNLSDVTVQIQNNLEKMYALGFYLTRGLKLQDLVVVMHEVKFQNVGIFTMNKEKGMLDIDQVILEFRSIMLDYLG